MTGKQRRELTAGANRLEPVLVMSADEISDGAVAHLQRVMQGKAVLKVRLNAADRAVFQAGAEELARRAGCELVKTIGRVVILAPKLGPEGTEAE